jgi:diguanylate cyclase (GGDEF)-like protein
VVSLSRGKRIAAAFFRPAAKMLSRLQFAQKFLVLALVLALPLAVVVIAYGNGQRHEIGTAAHERVGVAAMRPLLALVPHVAAMRHAATINPGTPSTDAVMAPLISAVDSTQRRYARQLDTGAAWSDAREQLVAAGRTTDPAKRVTAYNTAMDSLLALINRVGDASELTLDPDLDTYYLADAIQFRLAALLDAATTVVDKTAKAPRGKGPAEAGVLSSVGVALGTMRTEGAALDQGISTAAARTRDPQVSALLRLRLAEVDKAISDLTSRLSLVELTNDPTLIRTTDSEPVATAIAASLDTSIDLLDGLLVARMNRINGHLRAVELLGGLALLLAIYLFVGFYLSVSPPIRRMVDRLDAVAAGSLDEHLPVETNDELAVVTVAINQMVDKVRDATEALAHEATHDNLTGLPNRAFIINHLRRMLTHASPSRSQAVLFVDLDGFKLINDSLGHSAGDEVLRTVAARISATVRPGDMVARLAGDEFLVICTGLPDVLPAADLAHRLLAVIIPEIIVMSAAGEAHAITVTASIGVAFVTQPTTNAEQLVSDADVAMYRAKERGRGRVEIFDEGLRRRVVERQRMDEGLRRALSDDQLCVYYQPVVGLATSEVMGYEALVRWAHPERGLLEPSAFMKTAEETGLVSPIGARVLRTACRQLAVWNGNPTTGHRPVHMAVNLSARQLSEHHLVDHIARTIDEEGVEPAKVWLEITESALLDDSLSTLDTVTALSEIGVQIAIDDFGTGFSSLRHLREYPIDVVKIDQRFVAGLGHNRADEAIVRSVVSLADSLGLMLVAEGVETAKQRDNLLAVGCTLAQGYLFGPPAPAPMV